MEQELDFFPPGTVESPDKFLELMYDGFINLKPELIFRISNLTRADQEFILTCFELMKLDNDPRNVRDARWIAELSLGNEAFNRIKINEPWVGLTPESSKGKTTLRERVKSSLKRGDEIAVE